MSFTLLDWAVVLAALVTTTWVGKRLAGKQLSIRDFFLGGKSLPWYAVSASIVATEISAVTYISLPSVVFKPGGNITYLQIGVIGSLFARLIVGRVLVPAYYEREIFSPYDFMGARLGERVRRMTTGLFSLGGVLGQAARVYLIAVVLEVILQRELAWVEEHVGIDPLVSAVCAIGLVSVTWTLLGGISAVIWTDAILFLLFLIGIGTALTCASAGIEGGFFGALSTGFEHGKFHFLDFDTNPTKAYTFWAALFAATWSGVGSYGTDQLIAQRLFCCRDARDARRAIVWSYAAIGITFLVSLVGVGLFAYYRANPMSGEALALFQGDADRVFPLFVMEAIPRGWKGLVVAGAFAAAISSLDSILAALSQTSLAALYLPRRAKRLAAAGRSEPGPDEERRTLRVSRMLVIFWGVVLCAAASAMDVVDRHYQSILDLALAMGSYTGGALIAGFFLALLCTSRSPSERRLDGSGYLWSAPLSVLTVFAIVWHQPWARWTTLTLLVGTLVLWIALRIGRHGLGKGEARRTLFLLLLLSIIAAVSLFAYGTETIDGRLSYRVLAWPWYIPAGSTIAFVFGYLLARPPTHTNSDPSP